MIAIIDYGIGNIGSISNAILKAGYKCIVTSNPDIIRSADKVIFPGVGQASFAMSKLKERDLISTISSLSQPVLGICLGMQLMCEYSEEGQTKGIGIFNAIVKKFENQLKVPHMGWNNLLETKGKLFDGFEEKSDVYFVHSYYVELSENTIAQCEYKQVFSAALNKNNYYGTQFHPEKSGIIGFRILQNFLAL